MELRNYLRLLRRNWTTLVASVIVGLALSFTFLTLTTPQYSATAEVFVTAANPTSYGDLQQGSQFAVSAASSVADIIDSPAVLGPISRDTNDLGTTLTAADLQGMVSSVARTGTSIIDVTATGSSASEVAAVANATATGATESVPRLFNGAAKSSGAGAPLVRLQVVTQATVPGAATSPNRDRVLALGVVIGLALGVSLAIARSALDNRLWRLDDVRTVTEAPVFALQRRGRRPRARQIDVRDHPDGLASDSYRSLRTNLSALGQGRSLLIVPVVPDQDARLVPLNLAWSIARSGRRVLLLDLDHGRSGLTDALNLPQRPGIADVLTGKVQLSEAIAPTTQEGVSLMGWGSAQASPSDLLSGPQLLPLLRQAEQQFGVVIIHTPALLRVSDAAVVAQAVQNTVLTFRTGKVTTGQLAAALEALRHVGVSPVGLVLNGLRAPLGRVGPAAAWRDSTSGFASQEVTLQPESTAPAAPTVPSAGASGDPARRSHRRRTTGSATSAAGPLLKSKAAGLGGSGASNDQAAPLSPPLSLLSTPRAADARDS